MLRKWLQRRREARAEIERDAEVLLTRHDDGGLACAEARRRARACWADRDRKGDAYWSKVAVAIREKTGLVTGVSTADKSLKKDKRPAESRVRR
jgi:hypothetical protein